MGRRPIRSANGATTSEPKAFANSPSEITTPRAWGEIAHSRTMPGAAKEIASTSKPSIAFRQNSTAMMPNWKAVIGRSAMTARGSLLA